MKKFYWILPFLAVTVLLIAQQPVSITNIAHVILDAGSAVIGHVIVDSGAVTATLAAETTKVIGTVNIATGQETVPMASASITNSALSCSIVSAASTNSTNCKSSAGNHYGFELYNTTTTVYYLRLYDSGSAPTCSSATGFLRSIPIPPASAAGGVGGVVSNFSFPVGYTNGISFCLTGGSSSTDNTNAAVGIFGVIRYK